MDAFEEMRSHIKFVNSCETIFLRISKMDSYIKS